MDCKTVVVFLFKSVGILIVAKMIPMFYMLRFRALSDSDVYMFWKWESLGRGLVSLVLVALHAAETSVAEAMMLCANKSEFWIWPANYLTFIESQRKVRASDLARLSTANPLKTRKVWIQFWIHSLKYKSLSTLYHFSSHITLKITYSPKCCILTCPICVLFINIFLFLFLSQEIPLRS